MLWFVTPAWQRYEVSALCFEQRRWAMDRLAESGIETQCVVVADDDNLDLARSFGFATVERDNEWLGRRFNDGIAYAAGEGAEWIVPIGSDSWIAPAYLDPLPDPGVTRTATLYALAARTVLAELQVPGHGVGPYMIHRKRLPRDKRPADDHLSKGVDGSTLAGLHGLEWEVRDIHPLQYVALRSFAVPQLNPLRHLVRRFGVREHRGGRWERLARVYPPDLVERTRIMLESRR
jgi:hypothetical protein